MEKPRGQRGWIVYDCVSSGLFLVIAYLLYSERAPWYLWGMMLPAAGFSLYAAWRRR
jgi:hypothetical protein